MHKIFRGLVLIVLSIAMVSPHVARAHPANTEDAAVNLLLRTLTHDHVYAHRISLGCVRFDTEETTAAYFQFVLREDHTGKCGGDPETSPVVDRYRVYRASGKIEWLEPIQNDWRRYNSARIR
jgi:hypothetical protein